MLSLSFLSSPQGICFFFNHHYACHLDRCRVAAERRDLLSRPFHLNSHISTGAQRRDPLLPPPKSWVATLYLISSLRGYRAVTTVEIPPRGRKSPFTSHQTGSVALTTSFSTWLAMFS